MQDQFDTQAMLDRVSDLAKDFRKSDAYPAIVGAIAGGIAGALIAAMIAGRIASQSPAPQVASVDGKRSEKRRAGWTAREVVELLTIVAALAKQARDWYQQERAKK